MLMCIVCNNYQESNAITHVTPYFGALISARTKPISIEDRLVCHWCTSLNCPSTSGICRQYVLPVTLLGGGKL